MSGFSLKDHLFNKDSVTYLAGLFYTQNTLFPKQKFITNILRDLPVLGLKERITRIRQELEQVLSAEYPRALQTILAALPPELNTELSDDDFGDFILAPLAEYVAVNGCTQEYLDLSLNALREITKRFSAEDAIRYFINAFPEETYQFLEHNAFDHNYHVRRLSSEGTRPTLPWCIGIKTDYREAISIVDILYVDPTRYVTRSVANHMNDISKINPDLVIKILKKWQKSKKQHSKEMNFIMRHSLRILIKRGYAPALELLGYSSSPKIEIENIQIITPEVSIGEALEFSFDLISLQDQNLMIDYIVHHQTKSGITSPKVFKIKKIKAEKGQKVTISKKQPFKIMTTKKLYPGEHRCELQINGCKYELGSFTLCP